MVSSFLRGCGSKAVQRMNGDREVFTLKMPAPASSFAVRDIHLVRYINKWHDLSCYIISVGPSRCQLTLHAVEFLHGVAESDFSGQSLFFPS